MTHDSNDTPIGTVLCYKDVYLAVELSADRQLLVNMVRGTSGVVSATFSSGWKRVVGPLEKIA